MISINFRRNKNKKLHQFSKVNLYINFQMKFNFCLIRNKDKKKKEKESNNLKNNIKENVNRKFKCINKKLSNLHN